MTLFGGATNWLRQLKAVYDTDPARFYLHIDTWHEEMVTRVRVFRMHDYSNWIALNYGESRCFTGIFQAFPDASLTESLQSVDVFQGHHGAVATYMKWVVNMPDFPAPDTRIPKKTMHATQKYDLTDFQHTLTCTKETSHRCNFSYCINPMHAVAEPHADNMNRARCFDRARMDAERGSKVRQFCERHSPPCLLQLASEPRTGKIITEYESLGNPTVISLPPQIKSTKGPPLLTIDAQIFRWQDEVRLLDREIPCPPTQQGLVDGKPDSLKCSAGIFGTRVRNFMRTLDE